MQDNEAMGSIMDYAIYRLSRAKEDLDAAELLFEHGDYRIANKKCKAYL